MRFHQAILAASLSLLFAAGLPAYAQAPSLDGKRFVAEAGPTGKPADEKDDKLTFSDGKFHSSSCDKYGFTAAPYKTSMSGSSMGFETETRNEKGERITWKGTVEGDTITGNFTYYPKGWFLNPNPAPEEHWFKGSKAP